MLRAVLMTLCPSCKASKAIASPSPEDPPVIKKVCLSDEVVAVDLASIDGYFHVFGIDLWVSSAAYRMHIPEAISGANK